MSATTSTPARRQDSSAPDATDRKLWVMFAIARPLKTTSFTRYRAKKARRKLKRAARRKRKQKLKPFRSKLKPLFRETDYRCCYCDKDMLQSVTTLAEVSVDHFWPRSRGGEDHISNRVACCHTCNQLKSDTLFRSIKEAREVIAQRRRHAEKVFQELRSRYRKCGDA